MRIVVSDRASDDLDTSFDFLAARSPTAARRFIEQIHHVFDDLAGFPMTGRERSDLARSLRSQRAGTYIVFYCIDENDIIIVRVLDGRMNIDCEMRE